VTKTNALLWKLEQLKTWSQIQASAMQYWFRWGIVVWLVSAVIILAMGLTIEPERKQNAVTWIIASVGAKARIKTIGLKTVWWKGDPYEPQVLAEWMDKHVYGGARLSQWLAWAAVMGIGPVSLIGSIGLWRVRKKAAKDGEQHIRGAQIHTVEELQKRIGISRGDGVFVGEVFVPREQINAHTGIVGSTGAGKSTLMEGILEQIEARGERVALVDVEGTFTAKFFNPKRGDVILNPLDRRWQGFDISAECERLEDCEAIATSLFPITGRMRGTTGEYFARVGRRVIRDVLNVMRQQGNADLRVIPELLRHPKALLEMLGDTEAAAELGYKDSRERRQFLSGIRTATDSFRYLDPQPGDLARDTVPWSARQWVTQGEGWCFFTVSESQKAAVLPFIGLALDLLGRQLLEQPLRPEKLLWLYFDELGDLPALATLPRIATRVRKRGGAIVYSIPDRSKLESVYGEHETDSILNAAAVRVYMQTNDPKTQEWVAASIGRHDVARQVESHTMGSKDGRDAVHLNPNLSREEYAITPSQAGQIPVGRAYLKVGAFGTAYIRIPLVEREEQESGFLPRAEAEELREAEQEEAADWQADALADVRRAI